MKLILPVVVLAFVISPAPACAREVIISLPLEGYYRPGRFMPVLISASDELSRAAVLTLRAEGALPTIVYMKGRTRALVPMLMLSAQATRLSWTMLDQSHEVPLPLTALAANERIVASSGADAKRMQRVREMFPGVRLITVDSDNAAPSGEIALVNLKPDDPRVAEMLAAGITVVGEDWQQQPALRGPQSALAGDDAYLPTASWQPGTSARVRRMILLCAVLISLAMLACATLLRGRRAIAGALLVVASASIGIELFRRSISPLWAAEGAIVVTDERTTQLDAWTYYVARATAAGRAPLAANMIPIFADTEQARRISATIVAPGDGVWLAYSLPAGEKLAFVHREVRAVSAPLTNVAPASTSPMIPLARRLYEARDVRIFGQGDVQWTDDQTLHWPMIVLRRGERGD